MTTTSSTSFTWSASGRTSSTRDDFAAGPALIPGVVGAHEVFHIAVVAGAALHARALLRLLPVVPPVASRPTAAAPIASPVAAAPG